MTIIPFCVNILLMIRSFNDDETRGIWGGEVSTRFPHDIQERARVKLEALNAAKVLNDLRQPPSNHLERLSRDRVGQWSIRINRQWRVCFYWVDDEEDERRSGPEEVEIVDYH